MHQKIISAGHICIDITPVFPSDTQYSDIGSLLEPGKLIHVKPAQVHTGGSVANTGLALKILGADVQLMGKIGKDAFGTMVQGILQQHGADGLIVDENSATSYSIVLAVPGIDRTFLHDPGANDTFCNEDIPESALEDATLFHFGYPPLMRSMYMDDGAELIRIFRRMKEKGIATSLDMASVDPGSEVGQANWAKILESVLPCTDLFVPSFEELCFMLNRSRYNELVATGEDVTKVLDMEKDVKPLAEKCLQLGCKVVLIKCGTAGMYFRTADLETLSKIPAQLGLDPILWADREGYQPCFQAEIVRSATGAGDTSIATFLLAATQGKAPADCVALAAAQGACAVTTYDALSGIQPLDVLERKIRSGWKTM